jgi:hypothetical protein
VTAAGPFFLSYRDPNNDDWDADLSSPDPYAACVTGYPSRQLGRTTTAENKQSGSWYAGEAICTNVTAADLVGAIVSVAVYDEDLQDDDFAGVVVFDAADFASTQPIRKSLYVRNVRQWSTIDLVLTPR